MRHTALLLALTLFAFVVCNDALVSGKWFDRIFIIMFENQAYEDVINDSNFLKFANAGLSFQNYYAITHPSQPNYIAQVAGSTLVVNSDGVYNLQGLSVVDLLEQRGVTWTAYIESYPGNCFTGATTSDGLYARKHNPFISFVNIQRNASRCANIVNANRLDSDLASGNLAQYMYYTPNMQNDGHNTGISFAGNYLNTLFSPRLSKFPARTLLLITWDEDNHQHGNHIYTVALGSTITAGTKSNTRLTHYSLLRTVEDNWGLGNLGRNDTTANTMF